MRVIHLGIRLFVLYAIDSIKRAVSIGVVVSGIRQHCLCCLFHAVYSVLFRFNRQLINAPIGRRIHLHELLTLTINNSVKAFYLNGTHPQPNYETTSWSNCCYLVNNL